MKILLILSFIINALGTIGQSQISASPIPVIFVTDLFHPRDDADDVYDLAAIYAMPQIDLKGVVLEQGRKQDVRSGGVAVDQLNYITGRNVPHVTGLADPLVSKTDTALNQDAKYQGGVQMILDTLRNSDKRVSIISVGSMRDVSAAYNRDPELFEDKLDRLLVFAGDARADYTEYNVGLDPHAYTQIMNSGLNIYWVPCFDGGIWINNGYASYWQVQKQRDLLEGIDPKLERYFLYNLQSKTGDPIAYLNANTNRADLEAEYEGVRNLWCTVVFHALFGVYDRDLFDFVPVTASFTNEGYARYDSGKPVMRFEVRDVQGYTKRMTEETRQILKQIES